MRQTSGQGVQVSGGGELAVEDGALYLGGLAKLHMQELFEAFHNGGKGSLVPAYIADGLVQIEGGEKLLEVDGIAVPIQRRLNDGSLSHEEIGVLEALLVVVDVEDYLVPGILYGFRNETFFFLASTLSNSMTRES